MIIRKLFQKIKDSRDCAKVRKIWILTLVYSNLYVGSPKSNDSRTFDLLDLKKTETGYKAISLVPYGLSLKQLEEQKDKLQDALDSVITIKKDSYKPKIFINIIKKAPKYEFTAIKTKENEIFLGYTLNGVPYLANLDIDNNYLIAGMRGTGKSVYLICILASYLLTHTNVDLHLVQIKKNELLLFKSHKATKSVSTTVKDTLLVLQHVMKEIDRRAKLFQDAGAGIDSVGKWNRKFKDKKLNRIFVVIEELSFFMDSQEKECVECWNLMQGIAKSGRSCSVGIIGVTQRGTVENLSSNLKSQLSKLVFKVESNTDSINLINTGECTKLPPRQLICSTGRNNRLVVPTIDENYNAILKLLPELKEPPTAGVAEVQKRFLEELRSHKVVDKVIKDIPEDLVVITPNKLKESNGAEEEILIDAEFKEIDVKEDKKTIVKTQRDKQILRFMEQYGAMTTKQVSNIFYPNNKTVESCRKRLNQLVASGILESSHIEKKKEKQYYLKDGGKPKSLHDIYVLNAYTSLINAKCKILEFKIEPHLMDNQVIPDAYIKFKHNGKIYNLFIEVDYSHFTAQSKIELLEQYSQENNQKLCMFIGKVGRIKLESKIIEIFKTDFKFSDIEDFLEKLEENKE